MVIGGAIVIVGIGGAVRELAATYQQALDDPMAETQADRTDGLPARMLMFAGIGALGIVPLLVGGTMLKIGILRLLLRNLKANRTGLPR